MIGFAGVCVQSEGKEGTLLVLIVLVAPQGKIIFLAFSAGIFGF